MVNMSKPDNVMSKIKLFQRIFAGNQRSHGFCDVNKPRESSLTTLHKPPEIEDFAGHLTGTYGIGVVPVQDDGMCSWGAIDIDNHGQNEDLDLMAIESKITRLKLPLIVCRSRSGGAHLYLFTRENVTAASMKRVLTIWMTELNVEGTDCVFPKQASLNTDPISGKRPFGNWINLPYLGALDPNKESDRYAIKMGVRQTLDQFLDMVNDKAITQQEIVDAMLQQYRDAPPCIKKAIVHKVPTGHGIRNDALFHISVYARKQHNEDVNQSVEAAFELMTESFEEPVPKSEAMKTIRSAVSKDYGYFCSKYPWKDWCDRSGCRQVAHGISSTDLKSLEAQDGINIFSSLIRYADTDPVMWQLSMDGVPVVLTTEELMEFKKVRMKALEVLNKVLPSSIKPAVWTDEILAGLMHTVTVMQSPEGSSPASMAIVKLREFVKRADQNADPQDPTTRMVILRGSPAIVIDPELGRCYAFRGMDFEDYLRKHKIDPVKNRGLWIEIKQRMDVRFKKVRINGRPTSVWLIEEQNIEALSQGGTSDIIDDNDDTMFIPDPNKMFAEKF